MPSFAINPKADRLRCIPLETVLPLCGGRPDRDDNHKWHTPEGVLSVTGPKFMNWNRHAGGGGAIDLVIHLQHLDFKAAVDWLAQHFPNVALPPPVAPTPRPPWRIPPPDPSKLERVKQYLVHQRRIDPVVLDPLVQSGVVYGDTRGNAVFLLLGKENLPVGAELRGTTASPWHGLAPGSQKDLGFFAVSTEPSPITVSAASPIILCESAIDAISCFALHPHCRGLSAAGARPNPLWLKPLLDQGCPIYCGFDADPTGDNMAAAMIAVHPAIKRLRPQHTTGTTCSRHSHSLATQHSDLQKALLLGKKKHVPLLQVGWSIYLIRACSIYLSAIGLGRARHYCPCFPSPLYSFRTVGFPQYGWKTAFAETEPSPRGFARTRPTFPGSDHVQRSGSPHGHSPYGLAGSLCLPSHRPLAQCGFSCPHLQPLLRPDAPVWRTPSGLWIIPAGLRLCGPPATPSLLCFDTRFASMPLPLPRRLSEFI